VYSFNLNKTIALGFSNGANIAASLPISNSKTIKGAILLRAMVPFVPYKIPIYQIKRFFYLQGCLIQ
jgi:predicted esterase